MLATMAESFDNGGYIDHKPVEFDDAAMEAHCLEGALPTSLDESFDLEPDYCGVYIIASTNGFDRFPAAFAWNEADMEGRAREFGEGNFVVIYAD